MRNLTHSDRLLIFAPHPDDESLATGGLLQRAFAAGTAVRVVFLTSGENNPWPQRWIEKRWNIRPADCARWAVRRRSEARAAMRVLGGRDEQSSFLNLPDGGLTDVLMRGGENVIAQFAAEIADWQPTVMAMPAAEDAHPDHSATHVLLRFALAQLRPRLFERLDYIVHAPRTAPAAPARELPLEAGEIARKRGAILCHQTQMALSEKRFTAFAGPREKFAAPRPAHAKLEEHPIHNASIETGRLLLVLRANAAAWPGAEILLAGHGHPDGPQRWAVPLTRHSACVHFHDETTGALLQRATIRHRSAGIEVRLPLPGVRAPEMLFVKLQRRSLLFDRAGWREVDCHAPFPTLPATASPGRQKVFEQYP